MVKYVYYFSISRCERDTHLLKFNHIHIFLRLQGARILIPFGGLHDQEIRAILET